METLINQAELSRLIDKPEGTLEQWRHKGIGPPFIKVGGRSVRYRPSDVEAWLEGQRVATSG